MYLTSPGLKVLAVDPATGHRHWVFDPWEGRGGRGVNRGVT
jgi:quinoprotein glucose dehydrogenase